MGRTFIRQDVQIRNSVTYDDAITPSEANYETVRPANIEDDFTSVRSQIQNILNRSGASFPSGNWYSDMTMPTYLENGSKRGVDALNASLHAIEKKRVLRDVTNVGVDVTVPAAVKSTGTLTLVQPADGKIVTIGSTVYTFKTALTPTAGQVLIGTDVDDSIANLVLAIAGDGPSYGTKHYCAAAHADVVAVAGTTGTMVATAKLFGSAGNLIVTTTDVAGGSWAPVGHLGSGAGDIVILGTGELPDPAIAAVGVVATLGTVVAYVAGFGAQSLAEVAGGTNALSPRNLLMITDATTGDPILSSTREIWGLAQYEQAVDGDSITDTTPKRMQITFVRPNAAFDDLEFVPYADITGKVINYTTRERVRLEDLNEFDFLRGAVVDVGSGSGVVDRQHAYDNQGTAPVKVVTNSFLDLNATAVHWEIRDKIDAILFDVLEGSPNASVIQIAAAVGTFDVNAAVNDFLNGISVDTGAGGTTINIGVSANQIDSGGALTVASGGSGDIKLDAAVEILFDDVNRTGASWSATSVKLSDTTQEWIDYKAQFTEVSLMNALVQASQKAARVKGYATLVADVIAGADVDKTTTSRLDVDLPSFARVGLTFVDDVDVYLNGELLHNEVSYPGSHDVAPGSTPAQGMLKFEFALKGIGSKPDQLCMIVWGS